MNKWIVLIVAGLFALSIWASRETPQDIWLPRVVPLGYPCPRGETCITGNTLSTDRMELHYRSFGATEAKPCPSPADGSLIALPCYRTDLPSPPNGGTP